MFGLMGEPPMTRGGDWYSCDVRPPQFSTKLHDTISRLVPTLQLHSPTTLHNLETSQSQAPEARWAHSGLLYIRLVDKWILMLVARRKRMSFDMCVLNKCAFVRATGPCAQSNWVRGGPQKPLSATVPVLAFPATPSSSPNPPKFSEGSSVTTIASASS